MRSFKDLALAAQIESICSVVEDIKKVQAVPVEMIGSERMCILIDAHQRLTTLMTTLDWNRLSELIDSEDDEQQSA